MHVLYCPEASLTLAGDMTFLLTSSRGQTSPEEVSPFGSYSVAS